MNHSPSEVIRQYLLDESLFDEDLADDWSLYVDAMPPKPHKVAAIYSTTGLKDGRLMSTGETIFHNGFQLRVRGINYNAIFLKLRAATDNLLTVHNASVTFDSGTYTINNVTQAADLIYLGLNPEESRRMSWVCNFLSTITMEDEA